MSSEPVEIIAEVGSTHHGNPGVMVEMVKTIRDAGCNTYKSQWVSDPRALCEQRGIDVSMPQATNELYETGRYLASYRRIAYPLEWHLALRHACQMVGLEYLCTVYLPKDVARLAPYVDRFKVASFEACYQPLWDALQEAKKPCIVSTGMIDTLEELQDMFTMSRGLLVGVLHCVSSYPLRETQYARLRRMRWLRECGVLRQTMPLRYGYSDHSIEPSMGAYAVAAGAEIIETHCRPEHVPPGNLDHEVSRSPKQLVEYVYRIREVEARLGPAPFIPGSNPAEGEMRPYRSVVR